MKNRLLIIGASGHGKVVADIAIKMDKWKNIAFLDDNEAIKESMGIKVIGKSGDLCDHINSWEVFVAIGNNAIRETILKKLVTAGATIPTLIHPSAIISQQVEIGMGTVIMAGAVINCCTSIGKGCIINTGATIDHDNMVQDYTHISPGVNLAGTVKVGKGSWLGIGCKVINNINITTECKIGAGAVVINDITEPGTYVGVPARRVKR